MTTVTTVVPRPTAGGVVVVCLLFAGCTTTSGETDAATSSVIPSTATADVARQAEAPDPRDGRPHAFTTSEFTFVDDSRPTPESDNGRQLESRTVGLWLYLPDVEGPAPLILFSHGTGGHPDAFEELHAFWAEAGYAVAAPIFPLTNRDAVSGFTNLFDVPGQPGDVSFIADQLLAMSADPSSDLAGRLDPERMAAAGLSAGGATTYEVAINDVGRDERFDAAVVFAGTRYTNTANGSFAAPSGQPVFLLHGDADPLIALSNAEEAYDDLSAPRYFATLLGGGHAGPFQDAGEGIEAQVPGMSAMVHESTLAFLDRYVLKVDEAEQELLTAVDDPALVTFVHDS